MKAEASVQITALLEAVPDDPEAIARLLPLVYEELRRMAHAHMRSERTGHTLQTTALVHEAYMKLVDLPGSTVPHRAYFFGAAARAMRQILVDHARHRTRKKRGGGLRPVTLEDGQAIADEFAADLLDLNRVLDRFETVMPRAARVVECRYFAGLSVEETAAILDVSARTVKRDWIVARAWLYRALHDPAGDPT